MKEKFKLVKETIKDAKLVAFDGCHKIYVAMDDISADKLEENGYIVIKGSVTKMFKAVQDWYKNSCGLKFVTSVSHNEIDPNLGYLDLIPQFAEQS